MIARRLAVALLLLFGLMAAGCGSLTPTSAAGPSHGRIVSVADGDTVSVRLDSGRVSRVRLLALDAPELSGSRYGGGTECGARAAAAFLDRFRGRRAVLVADPSQDGVDRYGRLLRYLQLPGGTDLGAALIARGLAMPYVFERPARRYGRYRALAQAARAAGRGTWARPCEGDFHSSVPGIQNGF